MIERVTRFSPCRGWRYTLWREWLMEGGLHDNRFLQVIGLNPSTADETNDDPTIRRCIDFAKRLGFGALCMTNIFAWRATDPKDMVKVSDPVGPANDKWLNEIAAEAGMVIAAWGAHGSYQYRGYHVKKMIPNLMCFRRTAQGHPAHPLYLPATLKPFPL